MPDRKTWAEQIETRRLAGEALEFEPASFAEASGTGWPDAELQSFLDELVESGQIRRADAELCPNRSCLLPLDIGMVANAECPFCHFAFGKADEVPLRSERYQIIGGASRDLRWMIVVHGMNTRGAWQEDLSWLIANKLKYSAPVLIHKYGWATVDVLWAPFHRKLAKNLGHKIRRASDYARARGLVAAPDVLVHSFGTRLFSLVLHDDEFADLRFGRVITAGSIIRPDFAWSSLIETEKIEGILNHMGGKDKPVLAAEFLIPGTGPSGRAGFDDPAAHNHLTPQFGHSGCLSEEGLGAALSRGGLWDRFFTQPSGLFVPDNPFRRDPWRPVFPPLRWLTRAVGIIILLILGPFSALRRLLDA